VRLRRVLTVASAFLAVAASSASATASSAGASATASDSGSAPGPWRPYRSQPFTDPAGTACPFALHGAIVRDEELVRTLLSNADGLPAEQEFTGPLVMRFTNLSNHVSVERNLSGTGWWFYAEGGTTFGHGVGHMGIGIHAVNITPPPGEYYLTGTFDFVSRPDGTRDSVIERGHSEDLCRTLSRKVDASL
jgi:hypothetical protein